MEYCNFIPDFSNQFSFSLEIPLYNKLSAPPDPEEVVHKLHEELQFLWTPVSVCDVNPAAGSMLTLPH